MGEMQISANQARDLTDRIKVGVEAVWDLVKQSYASRAWSVLGYASWDDYCTREFGTSRIKLPREERQEVVASMREIGMSTRAIASATGNSVGTVHAELSRRSELNTSEPAPVTGTDGKTYTPRPAQRPAEPESSFDDEPEPSAQVSPGEEIPTTNIIGADDLEELNQPEPEPEAKAEPSKPRRSPITDDANRIGWEIRKAAEKLDALTEDDRYTTNKEKVTPLLRGHLQYVIETATGILDDLTKEDK